MQDVHGTTGSGSKVLESWWQRWQKSEQSLAAAAFVADLLALTVSCQRRLQGCDWRDKCDSRLCNTLSLPSRGRFPVLLFPTPWTCWGRRAGSCRAPRWPSPPCTRARPPRPPQPGWRPCSTPRPRGWLLPSRQRPPSHPRPSRPRDKRRPRRRALFPRPRRARAPPRGRLRPRPRWRRSRRPRPSPSLCQPRSQPSSSQRLCRHSRPALQWVAVCASCRDMPWVSLSVAPCPQCVEPIAVHSSFCFRPGGWLELCQMCVFRCSQHCVKEGGLNGWTAHSKIGSSVQKDEV